MMKTISATEARVHFGEVLDEVEDFGSRIIIERAGKPAAAIISMKDLGKLKDDAYDPTVAIEKARALRDRIAEYRHGEPLSDVAEEIRAMREERDAELLGGLL